MSGFWIIAWILTAIAIVTCAVPLLLRNDKGLDRHASAMRIFNDQLDEIERDTSRGVLGASDAKAATNEIKRRMLALVRNKDATSRTMKTISDHESLRPIPLSLRICILVLAVFGPAIGLFGYSWLGRPDLPAQPLAQRTSEVAAQAELGQTATALKARLDANGGTVDDWLLLGQTYMELKRPEDAIDAFRKAVGQPGAHTVAYSRLAEAILFSTGVITPEAGAALDRALELQPGNVAAIYYKSVEVEQAGRLRQALEMVEPILANAPPDAPWRPNMQQRVDELAARVRQEGDQISAPPFAAATQDQSPVKGPTAEDVAAASEMNADDRNAMIRSMVERLAEKLENDPDNVDGWLQLIQSYIVLEDKTAAAAALKDATDVFDRLPTTNTQRRRLEEFRSQIGP